MKLGVNGYVAKTAPYKQLLQAIDGVMSGALYFSADTGEAPERHEPARSDADPHKLLSDLEIAVARLVVAGLSSKEIAAQCSLTVRSIDKHRSNIMRKLGVKQAAGLVRLCVLHGIK